MAANARSYKVIPYPESRDRVSQLGITDLAQLDSALQRIANWDAERAVVGSILQWSETFPVLNDQLEPGDFSNILCGYCWYAARQLVEAGADLNLITITQELSKYQAIVGKQGQDHVLSEISGMVASVPIGCKPEDFAKIIRESALRFRLLKAAEDIKAKALDTALVVEQIKDECNRLVFRATDQGLQSSTDTASAVNAYMARMEDLIEHGQKSGVPSGFNSLDRLIGAFSPNTVTILAGGAGMGKTTLLLSMIVEMIKAEQHVALFALEMTREEIIQAFVAMLTGIPKVALRKGDLTPSQWSAFVTAAGEIANWTTLHIVDEFRGLTPMQLRRKTRRIMVDCPLDLIAIDGLWLMQPDTPSKDGRWRDVALITQELTSVASPMENGGFNLPILMTHQYKASSDISNPAGNEPTIGWLAEGSGIERNVQIIIGMHRASYFKRSADLDDDLPDVTHGYIIKDRTGSCVGDKAVFRFDRKYSRYVGDVEDVRIPSGYGMDD
jgi:replicative DNA helicase